MDKDEIGRLEQEQSKLEGSHKVTRVPGNFKKKTNLWSLPSSSTFKHQLLAAEGCWEASKDAAAIRRVYELWENISSLKRVSLPSNLQVMQKQFEQKRKGSI